MAKSPKPKSPKAKRSARATTPKKKKAAAKATSPDGSDLIEGVAATTLADVVLQASMEIQSVDVAEVPAQTNVFVLECQPLEGGGQRALIALGDPAKGHAGGWVTSVSPNGKRYLRAGESFVRPNPVCAADAPSAEMAALDVS